MEMKKLNVLGKIFSSCCSRKKNKPRRRVHKPIYIMTCDFVLKRVLVTDIRVSNTVCHMMKVAGRQKYAMIYFIERYDSAILHYILKYGEYHKGDERRKKRNKEQRLREGIQTAGPSDFRMGKDKPEPSHWDMTFMSKVDPNHLLRLWQASIDLGVPGLTELIFLHTGLSLREKNDDEIRKMLGIQRDFDRKEDEQLEMKAQFLAGDFQ